MESFFICYVAVMELFAPGWSPGYEEQLMKTVPERFQTCVDLVETSKELGAKIDPALLVSTAYEESKFDRHAISRVGARGPLQILPQYWCPNRKAKGCDFVVYGVKTLERFLSKHRKVSKALCHYNAGNVCGRYGRKYAGRILARKRRLEKKYSDLVYELWRNQECVHETYGNKMHKTLAKGLEQPCATPTVEDVRLWAN